MKRLAYLSLFFNARLSLRSLVYNFIPPDARHFVRSLAFAVLMCINECVRTRLLVNDERHTPRPNGKEKTFKVVKEMKRESTLLVEEEA